MSEKIDATCEPDTCGCGGDYGRYVVDMQGPLALTTSNPRPPNTFKYDHQVWFGGVFYMDGSPVLNQPASEQAEQAYFIRRLTRLFSKGRPHICRVIEWPAAVPANRQQRRHLLRKLKKVELRKGQACHNKALTLTEAPSTIAL